METLFQFALKRDPIEKPKKVKRVKFEQPSEFQNKLKEIQATGGDTVRPDSKDAARQFAASELFLPDNTTLPINKDVIALSERLDELQQDDRVDQDDVLDAIEDTMGDDPSDIVETDDYSTTLEQLRDSILAIKLLPEEHHRPIHRLVRALQDLELVQHVHDDETFPDEQEALRLYRTRPLEIPDVLTYDSVLEDPTSDDPEQEDDEQEHRREELTNLVDRYHHLSDAVEELTTVRGEQLVQTPSEPVSESLPPSGLRPLQLYTRELSDGLPPSLRRSLEFSLGTDTDGASFRFTDDGEERDGTSLGVSKALLSSTAGIRTTFSGNPKFTPQDKAEIGFKLTNEAANNLSSQTKDVIGEIGVEPSTQPLDEVVNTLKTEVGQVTKQIDELSEIPLKYSFKQFGDATVVVTTPVKSPKSNLIFGNLDEQLPEMRPPTDRRVPRSHGKVAPAGVADLILVKQHPTGYEMVDIAHVENILQGERKHRTHRKRREVEELVFQEAEVTTSEENELESTGRFEMARETSETIKEDASLKAGLTVSGKYGPVVEFSASAEGSMSRAKEQATKTASTFAKDVTQRSAQKITERVLERESRRTTTEIEDTNEHTLDNTGGEDGTGGDDHVVGVYQWLEKVYEAQLFNYGLRTMYEFMVPEPGAFLIEALRRAHTDAIELRKPIPFTLPLKNIYENNYPFWVKQYGAADVQPPPEPFRTKTLEYSAGGGDDKTHYTHSAQVQIDDGYQAIHASVGVIDNIWDEETSIDVLIGNRSHRFRNNGAWIWSTPLANERGSVPFALATFKVSDIGAVVEVNCKRTDRAMTNWQHDTHAKLDTAYRTRLAEYEEKLAALKAEAGIEIEGQSPRANQQLISDELKKACITILTEQHYDLFDAIDTGKNGLPQIDLYENKAEGPYVRFFEQAFEWEHLTWVGYPYYWGRKSEWPNRIAYEDTDPQFNEFLKAGYCRVSVPVRESFEGAVDHFMTFGDVWEGGPLPKITSPLFLPIADELAEQLDRPGKETPQGEPWEVRLPTSLVHLRQDDDLPTWEKDEDGNWEPQ